MAFLRHEAFHGNICNGKQLYQTGVKGNPRNCFFMVSLRICVNTYLFSSIKDLVWKLSRQMCEFFYQDLPCLFGIAEPTALVKAVKMNGSAR